MGRAVALAMGQLFSGPILRILGLCAVLSALTFVGVWVSVDYAVEWLWPTSAEQGWIGWLEGFFTLLLAWFLLPVVASLFIALFLDFVCGVVEERHYPDLPKAPGVTAMQSLGVALSYFFAKVVINALLLFLLLVPPLYLVAWVLLNGYLLGREYTELVSLRRLSPGDTQKLRTKHSGEVLLIGVMIASLLALPLINLIAPVFASVFTVHRFHDWRASGAAN